MIRRRNLAELTGSEVNQGIEDKDGHILLTGAGIEWMRILQIRQGLRLQKLGVKMHSRLPRASTYARRLLGLHGNLDRLIEQVEELVARIQRERGASTS